MKRQNLDREWIFEFSGKGLSEETSKGNNKGNYIVDLPHDFSIIQKRDPDTFSGAYNGFFPGGFATYKKMLFIPKEWKGKKVILEFEGIYMNSAIHINNNLIVRHPYGYTSFHCDLTPYILYGHENLISVTVNNSALPNTRWYSGSGIYRHVWLLVGDSIHIAPWGVYAVTPQISSINSMVVVKTNVENSGEKSEVVVLRSALLDANRHELVFDQIEVEVPSSGSVEAMQELNVYKVNLWSVDNPYLYTLKSETLVNNRIVDSVETQLGIRSITFDSVKGFQLNGNTVKLKGGCVHHDCGLLGAAAYDRAEERKVELLKDSGFNAVRCAHNPPSPAFLNACDRLGMLVIDEAFDCWRESKTTNDYGNYFEDWWKRDMASMILRDRNHPCIIMWSIGNEIIERDGRSEGNFFSQKLADYVRSLDGTRAVTNALYDVAPNPLLFSLARGMDTIPEGYDYWGEFSFKYTEPLDVVGYNYLLFRYESDGEKYPGRIICGTETFPMQAYECWDAVERLPYVIGDFVWTSLDYLGEAGIGHVWYNGEKGFLGNYPWHQAFCGDIDICGFKRPQSYYRDCVWGISNKPYIAVHKPEYYGKEPDISRWGWPDVISSWTWPGYEGKPCIIDVYSTNSEVELFLNGKSLGRKPAGKENRYIAKFETVYEAGELVAVGWEKDTEHSETVIKTAGKPSSIRLTPDRSELNKTFGDLTYVTVELLDEDENIVHNATNNLYFTVCGVGSLLAVGTGNPVTEEMYTGNQRKSYEGRAMVVVMSSGEIGDITLTASAEGIPSNNITIKVQ